MAIPGMNMTTARAWKNFLLELRLRVGMRLSAASRRSVATADTFGPLGKLGSEGTEIESTNWRDAGDEGEEWKGIGGMEEEKALWDRGPRSRKLQHRADPTRSALPSLFPSRQSHRVRQ